MTPCRPAPRSTTATRSGIPTEDVTHLLNPQPRSSIAHLAGSQDEEDNETESGSQGLFQYLSNAVASRNRDRHRRTQSAPTAALPPIPNDNDNTDPTDFSAPLARVHAHDERPRASSLGNSLMDLLQSDTAIHSDRGQEEGDDGDVEAEFDQYLDELDLLDYEREMRT